MEVKIRLACMGLTGCGGSGFCLATAHQTGKRVQYSTGVQRSHGVTRQILT